ncbi:hypothetical protein JMJ35_000903 [Cladonia borealis]|uniref:Methionine aminopeptidase n=1 Tax=Cladonia borealis TaxID=184061 RepID=A0AA39V9R5_9LECA|nr:hypothetical protein JMJ35_000903 [Cladonia borealis]
MAEEVTSTKKRCIGVDCPNEAGTLQCPTCLKIGKESSFCSQDCFKRSWSEHKAVHKTASTALYNPFPTFPFTGSLRPIYPLSPRRPVPDSIPHPNYARDGDPKYTYADRNKIRILDKDQQEGMRKVCRLSREVLDIAAREVKPGVTTDHIDEVVHKACIERNAYPSPLNYVNFPKSVCTSVNEVICHGIPDKRILLEGDIVNLDVSLYHNGFHGDLNETYYVGPLARSDPSSVRVVETARECLNEAIKLVKPGMAFRDPGGVIEKHAKSRGCSVIKTYCGHGVNALFHGAPSVPHYAKNKAVGVAKPGMTFTIEPMISLGTYKDKTWPDDWTSVTQDGSRTAQFEHTLLVTEDGVEVLTARMADSPGGPVAMPPEVKADGDADGKAGNSN